MHPVYRQHQHDVHRKAAEAYLAGHRRILVAMPTGSGKTTVAGAMLQRAKLQDDDRGLFVVPRITLCEQSAATFADRFGLDVSIMQGNHPAYAPDAPVQVCSVQTLARRGIEGTPKLILIDEAHIKFAEHWKLAEKYPDAVIIGLTATPTSPGLSTLYQTLVPGPSLSRMVADGWLARSVVYEPVDQVYNVEGVDSNRDDFVMRQLGECVTAQTRITASVIDNWLQHGQGRPTLCFATNKAHSMEIVARFEQAGIGARHIQDSTPLATRQEFFRELRTGRISIISSVGCLTEGLDLPLVSCLVFARPTKSDELHIQMWGRGLRPLMLAEADGDAFDLDKRDCLIFDHAGNCRRLQLYATDYNPQGMTDSDESPKKRAERRKKELGELTGCRKCGALKPRGVSKCPECGHNPVPPQTVEEMAGTLSATVDETSAQAEREIETRRRWYLGMMRFARDKGYKQGWAFFAYQDKFGDKPLPHWRHLPLPRLVDQDVSNWLLYRQIKAAKTAAKRGRTRHRLVSPPTTVSA